MPVTGFRGKMSGHDVDFLITHPDEGKEEGLIHKVIVCLESQVNQIFPNFHMNPDKFDKIDKLQTSYSLLKSYGNIVMPLKLGAGWTFDYLNVTQFISTCNIQKLGFHTTVNFMQL